MPSHVTPPRGMRDFLPAEKRRRERVLATVRDVYRSRGFDEIETPVVEGAEFLWSGLGGDNEKQVFAVLRRGLDLDAVRAVGSPLELADLGLRFDLTVPLARFYASHRAELPTVFRSVQIAPVWRAERPQKGRYRQFVQCDIDILGEPGQQAEVELISATTDVLDALGLRGTTIRVNDRRVLLGVLAHWGVAPELTDRALIEIDKLDKIGVEGVATQLRELGVGGDDLAAQLHQLGEATFDSITGSAPPAWLDAEAAADLVALRDALPGATLVLDPTLVRGMGYYTGTIFEVAHPDFSYSLGGGGRYDGMIGRFLGTDGPTTTAWPCCTTRRCRRPSWSPCSGRCSPAARAGCGSSAARRTPGASSPRSRPPASGGSPPCAGASPSTSCRSARSADRRRANVR
jgi:histidyl-tRNA synthetase